MRTEAAERKAAKRRRWGPRLLALAADARLAGEQPGDIAGTALAGGDLDGDGFDDVVISAPGCCGLERPGSAYVFYGGLMRITGHRSLAEADARLDGEAPGDMAGRNVTIAGDLNGDGLADLAVGAVGDDEGGEDAGAVSLAPGGERLTGEVGLADVAVGKLTGEAAGDRAGRGLHGTGDLNRDGRADLLVSAEGHDAGGEDAGAVYGVLDSVPSTAPPAGFHWEATGCVEPVAVFFVDPDAAAEHVPDPFEVRVDELGNATLAVAAIDCARTAIDGQPTGPALLSDVGIEIEPPDGSPGGHLYQLWQPTTNPRLRARMAALGMVGALVTDATFEAEITAATVDARAEFPWAHAPYAVEATSPRPVPDPPGGNTWWHAGPRGAIKISYTFLDMEVAPGAAAVSAGEGSPLADLLGGTDRTADLGLNIFHHHYEGTIELVGSP